MDEYGNLIVSIELGGSGSASDDGGRHRPITLEIIQSSLQAISDEMFAAFRKTAMSAIIYEVLDMGTGITDAEGNLASSGAGIPAFVGVLDKAVQRVIELNDPDEIRPGDVFVTNDPFYGGVTHLNDVVLVMPVFADGRAGRVDGEHRALERRRRDGAGVDLERGEGDLPGGAAAAGGQADLGGSADPAGDADHEVQQPAAGLPAGRHVGGHRRRARRRAADRRAGGRSTALETFTTALEVFMDYGERVARRALGELPKGTFGLEEEQDAGAVYAVTVTIGDEEFVVDLRDNPDQDAGPNNASRDGTMVAAQMVFMNITGAHAAANAGHFRPMRLLTAPGVGVRSAAAGRLRDVLRGRDQALRPDLALPGAPPRRAAAGRELRLDLRDVHRRAASRHRAALHDRRAAGRRLGRLGVPRRQQRDVQRLPRRHVQLPGGGGGGPLRPVRRPALAERRAGRRRGAPGRKGIVLDYRVRSDGCFFTCAYTRNRHRPWSLGGRSRGGAELRGGDPGATGGSRSTRS